MKFFQQPNPETVGAHWVNIKVTNYSYLIEFLQWRNLPFHTRMNYDWYFKYRAALLQVKYPYYDVEMRWGIEEVIPDNLKQLQLKNKIAARKRKITELTTKMQLAKANWSSLFPIETDKVFQMASEKLHNLTTELNRLEEIK